MIALGGVLYVFRVEIMLGMASFAMDRRPEIGPTRAVEWQTGADPSGRAPADRPPNVVLILPTTWAGTT
jgi:hypothetical protein